VQTLQADYFAPYRSIKLTRNANGVLVVEVHNNGQPFIFTAQDHTEFVDAFYRIAQDRANKIVILTGAGGGFIPDIDFSSFGNVADPGVWSQVHDEGAQILENIANILTTIEGLARDGQLHPVQEGGFIEYDGFQCGFCTSGQIMSAVAMIEEAKAG
jgi:hypothetical protein